MQSYNLLSSFFIYADMQTILWKNVNLFLKNCIFLIKLILSFA